MTRKGSTMDTEKKNILNDFLPKLKSFIKSETVIGEPYAVGEVTLIPVNSVKVGFGYGGADFNRKSDSLGGGGGVLLTPVAFIVVKGDEVSIQSLSTGTIENVMSKVPEVVDRFVTIFQKAQKKESAPKDSMVKE